MSANADYVGQANRLQCAYEAIAAHGNTAKTDEWYRHWMPIRYAKYGLPTTVQYSLSCFLMDHAKALLDVSPNGRSEP